MKTKNIKCLRTTERHYKILCETIKYLYGQSVLDELEKTVNDYPLKCYPNNSEIGARLHSMRLAYTDFLSKNFKTKRRRRLYSVRYKKSLDKKAISKMRLRSKTRKHCNRLLCIIRREFGTKKLYEMIWKSNTMALGAVAKENPFAKASYIYGLCDNDLSLQLHYLRWLYKKNRPALEGDDIHWEVNMNYINCTLRDKGEYNEN